MTAGRPVMGADATLYLGSLYAWRRIRANASAAVARWNCGRRFGHVPVFDDLGIYKSCSRCRAPMP